MIGLIVKGSAALFIGGSDPGREAAVSLVNRYRMGDNRLLEAKLSALKLHHAVRPRPLPRQALAWAYVFVTLDEGDDHRLVPGPFDPELAGLVGGDRKRARRPREGQSRRCSIGRCDRLIGTTVVRCDDDLAVVVDFDQRHISLVFDVLTHHPGYPRLNPAHVRQPPAGGSGNPDTLRLSILRRHGRSGWRPLNTGRWRRRRWRRWRRRSWNWQVTHAGEPRAEAPSAWIVSPPACGGVPALLG